MLDLILTNLKYIKEAATIPLKISDHLPVYIVRKKMKEFHPKVKFEGKSYSRFDDDEFTQNLLNLEWNFVYQPLPLSDIWDKFYQEIETLLETTCPLKKFSFGRDKRAWMSNELIEFIKDRDSALKKALRTKTQEDKKRARNIRHFRNSMVRNAKSSYIKNQLGLNKKDSKKLWHSIKSVIPGNSQPSSQTINLKHVKGEYI